MVRRLPFHHAMQAGASAAGQNVSVSELFQGALQVGQIIEGISFVGPSEGANAMADSFGM